MPRIVASRLTLLLCVQCLVILDMGPPGASSKYGQSGGGRGRSRSRDRGDRGR
jgi:hypothetical protein